VLVSRRAVITGLVVGALATGRAGAADETVVTARLTAAAGEAVVEVTVAPGWHINAHAPRDQFLIPTALEVIAPPGVRPGDVQYPEPVDRPLAFSGGKPLLLYEGRVRLVAPLAGSPAPGAPPLRAKLRYQACTDTRCLPPATLELVAREGTGAPRGAGGTLGGGEEVAGWIARWGYGVTLLWIAMLGMALNLTPCVYPLISVTVAFFGGRSGGQATAGTVGRALCYVLGICISFSVLGVAAAFTGSLFGAALQRPEVLGAIALLMVILALSNFGLYQLQLPAGVLRRLGRAGEGVLGAVFMGLTMGVVAAPCIGPIVLALLLYVGARGSPALGFAVFFTLALGMGAPYIVLAVAAGRLRRLPRGGAWLAWMERLFGFLLFGLALHFAGPLLPPSWVRAGWTLVLASAGVVLGFLDVAGRPAVRWAQRAAGLVVIALGAGALLVAGTDSPIAWRPFSEQALAEARASDRPVLIDFQAAWCLPCREMDRTTFRDAEVVRAAAEFATLRADVTEQDEQTAALMARFGVAGVPTYVLLGADGRERRRLVGFVPAGEMAEAMAEAGSRG